MSKRMDNEKIDLDLYEVIFESIEEWTRLGLTIVPEPVADAVTRRICKNFSRADYESVRSMVAGAVRSAAYRARRAPTFRN